ncbi:MAG: PIN domain-containing protein [Candidatus Methanoperedens sp.]|nr:PIN domain-containing protein [Candidatus Methanoperedens sp.]
MEKGEEKTKIEFVIDTNILISALIPKKTKLRDILLSGDFRIYAPEYLLKELDKYWNLILEKAEKKGVIKSNIELTKEELLSKIFFEPDKFYFLRIEEAFAICQEFDEKDTPFIALSLMLDIPILTNDKGIIENAGLYRVLTIEELFKVK